MNIHNTYTLYIYYYIALLNCHRFFRIYYKALTYTSNITQISPVTISWVTFPPLKQFPWRKIRCFIFIIKSFYYCEYSPMLLPNSWVVPFLLSAVTPQKDGISASYSSPSNQPRSQMSSQPLNHRSIQGAGIQTAWVLCLEIWVLVQPLLLAQGYLLFSPPVGCLAYGWADVYSGTTVTGWALATFEVLYS